MTRSDSLRFPCPSEAGAQLDEQDLVERVRAGDVRAFEQLFTMYYGSLCGFVDSYVHSEAIAEEVVSDLFRRIWERRAEWTPAKSVATYLFGAARNRALDHLKHARVERRAAAILTFGNRVPAMGTPPLGADAAVRAAELEAAIERAVEALPERCRAVFTLRRRHHLSYAEIAGTMGTTVKTVEVQIGLALKALRKSLVDWLE